MKRDMALYVEEYHRIRRKSNIGSFYFDDAKQIFEISENELDLVFNAMYAGFITGYLAAKRENRRKLEKKT